MIPKRKKASRPIHTAGKLLLLYINIRETETGLKSAAGDPCYSQIQGPPAGLFPSLKRYFPERIPKTSTEIFGIGSIIISSLHTLIIMYALLTLSDDSARDHCGNCSCRDRSTDLLTLAHCDDLLVFLLVGSKEAVCSLL